MGRECGTLRKLIFRIAADALGGEIGGEEVGVLGFKGAELVHAAVIMDVGPGGGAEDVVEVLVVAEGVDAVLGESSMRCWGEVDIVADYRKIGVVG